ncbi:MAG: hypothetical protein R3E77_16580 [Steroidobacteraceae bacterium]
MNEQTATATPKHLWVVGILATLWNSVGCVDYFMTQTKNMNYLKAFTPEQIDYFGAFPAWADAAWALGVWGALAGSILLLLRQRFAVHAFGLSLLGMAVAFLYQFGLSDALALFGAGPSLFTLVIVVIGIALFVYARKMAARGVLG